MTRIAFVMDPVESLNLKKDSTLAMIRSAQMRGWSIDYLTLPDMAIEEGVVVGHTRSLALTRPFVDSMDPADGADGYFELGDEKVEPLADFDVVMMRKDPPFDMEYIYATYLLERAEEAGAHVVNRPQSLRDCNEKLFATRFPQCTPPLVVSRREDILSDFHRLHDDVIFKKLDGMGGMSIFRVRENDPNLRVVIETLTENGQRQIMAQRFIPEIVDGDKRILMIDGEPLPYALARIPMQGETRGNLAAGGTGVGQPLSERDRYIAAEIGDELRARGLTFVGIDVIGDYLTEINVTCPTCIRELDQQFDLDIAGQLLDSIEATLASRAGAAEQ